MERAPNRAMLHEAYVDDALAIAENGVPLLSLKVYIVEILLKILDYEEDFIVSEEWRQEIQKRSKEIDNDPSVLVDGERFMAELKQRYL